MSTAREVMAAYIEAVAQGDRERMVGFYAPDVVIEMPFQPGMPRTEGRETIRQRMMEARSRWLLEGVENAEIHETDDPEVLIAELAVRGTVTESGKKFSINFVMVTRIKDGLIVHSRDYNNPLEMAAALSMTPEDLSAMLNAV